MRRRRSSRRSFTRRSWNNRVYAYKRATIKNLAIVTNTSADTAGAYTFTLSDVPGYSEFTALYDQYKIKRVRMEFLPKAVSPELVGSGGAANYNLWTALDYDDSTTPTLAQLLQRSGLKRTRITAKHTRTLAPRISVPVYNGTFGTAYRPSRGWIDCQATDVPHYGVKYVAEIAPNANSLIGMDILITYWVCFKNVV